MSQITLFSGQTSDGSSNVFYKEDQHPMNIYIEGNLGGGSLTLEAQTADGNWVTNQSSISTGFNIFHPSTFVGRVTLSGSVDPNLNVYVEGTNVRGG